jgi:cytochrome c biogenesis protein CcmG/thiol:disulfide interchange protein DsbE
MATRDTENERVSPPDDSPEANTGPDQPRRRSIGLWLVVAALGLWLGVMLFVVGPDDPVEPAASSLRITAGDAERLAATRAAAGVDDAPRRRSAEPRLIPASRRDPAPGFALPDMDGGTATLADYTGRVLLLNFWATWCLPCRAEMPWFVDFQTRFGDDGFAVLGVSVDEPGWDIVEPFIERSPVNYRIALADTVERQAPFGPKNVLPTTWLIDRQGRIAAEHVGLVSREAIEAEIRLLVAE